MKEKYQRDDIIKIIKEEGIEFIYLQFTDIFGVMKNVAIPAEEISKALNNEVAFDGSCVDGFVRIEESDMYLRPDLDTFCIYPWGGGFGREARFICDVYNTDGTPFEGDPRYILKKVCNEAKEMGYTMQIGPECEFFLFHTDEKGKPTLITHDDAGYFDLAPIDLGENARRDMVMTLKKMGFEVEASHHEIAPGQHEIDFKFDDALYAADKIMTFKSVVKIVAKNHGLHATFMPKPIAGIPGSGMHINQLLLNDGKNAFYDSEDKLKLSKVAYNYLAGLLKHAKSICAITNPTINSYKRLISGYEAPVYISWSSRNTSPLVRVPMSKENNVRFELRNPDPSCNPYLAIAVILKSGLDGIKNNLTPPKSIDRNINSMDEDYKKDNSIESLPESLYEAVKFLCSDETIKEALGRHVLERFVEAKKIEWEDYNKSISSWEIEKYLTKF
ncbi:glutamine synthetase [Caloramator quimbayensis]|uniref:Glutamine synthetase n=1 Tax=Caloramator quimbayensis TaxID=1147123 RepID=A0A1T4Y882_9CLOT|nr:type I glutamate--ammonia ligase [Caloramator quimbayensis]SKA97495.1 glutamine synthetase [Caloramator quimbayensis]